MAVYGDDIYTEPETDPDTLSNLGPLAPMAGVWQGSRGADEHPVVDGTGRDAFEERYELQPIDAQTNGPQLLYGLRVISSLERQRSTVRNLPKLLDRMDQLGQSQLSIPNRFANAVFHDSAL